MSNASACAIKCTNARFRTFLREELAIPGVKDGIDDDPEWLRVRTALQATSAIYYLLNIESRKELNEEGPALSRWNHLLGKYEAWMRGMD